MTQVRCTRPPHALKKATLDNIVLFPVSALPYKAIYQEIANRLPAGGVLIVTARQHSTQLKALQATATLLRAKGHPVTLLPSVK